MRGSYVWVDNILYHEELARRGKAGYSEIYFEALARAGRADPAQAARCRRPPRTWAATGTPPGPWPGGPS